MKKLLLAGMMACLIAAGCGGSSGGSGNSEEASGASCDIENPPLYQEDTLTVATDRPAYPPWFEGSPENYTGYEGDIANEIANRMELPITWVVEPFNNSYAPGAKDWDMDLNQITITEEREQAVTFSDGYFENDQGILTLGDSSVADAKSLSDLKDAKIGVQVGTTSLSFVNERINPDQDVSVYDTSNDVRSALENGQIDALVTDLVTTVYLRDFEIDDSVVIGRYPTGERFGILFQKDSELVGCVNEILTEMKDDGTLEELQQEYLQQYLEVPELED